MPVAELIAELVTAVNRELPVEVDGWAPTVQGAVGHVVGLRGVDGSGYVLKVYPRNGAARAATEVAALARLLPVPGVGVPEVVLAGELHGAEAVAYVVLSRLPGVRWADRRDDLSPAQSSALTVSVGRLLRRLHVVPGERFGGLLAGGTSWPTAWQRVDARCDELVRDYVEVGGPVALADRVRGLVDRHRSALGSCRGPVLCHNDFIGSNILIRATGDPVVCGVVDLERASWDDPLADLAQTRLHVRYHDPAGADALVTAYGVGGEAERHRLDVHEVLHALEERTWISRDRPAGWQASVAALDAYLVRNT